MKSVLNRSLLALTVIVLTGLMGTAGRADDMMKNDSAVPASGNDTMMKMTGPMSDDPTGAMNMGATHDAPPPPPFQPIEPSDAMKAGAMKSGAMTHSATIQKDQMNEDMKAKMAPASDMMTK